MVARALCVLIALSALSALSCRHAAGADTVPSQPDDHANAVARCRSAIDSYQPAEISVGRQFDPYALYTLVLRECATIARDASCRHAWESGAQKPTPEVM